MTETQTQTETKYATYWLRFAVQAAKETEVSRR